MILSEPSSSSNSESTYKDWHIHHFDEIDSTSSWLKRNRETLADHSVAVAKFQTAGRGRLGRKWVAPPATSLMFSMLLRPGWPIDQASWLMMIAGLAAAETVSEFGQINIQLKWPNDIVVMRANEMQKMGGILSEATTDDGMLSETIIGIGININMMADQLPTDANTPPCSLRSMTSNTFDLDQILLKLLDRFEHYFLAATAGQSPSGHWEEKLVTLGQPVMATLVASENQAQKIEGIATGVDNWGRLLITTESGDVMPVAAGDVTLRTS